MEIIFNKKYNTLSFCFEFINVHLSLQFIFMIFNKSFMCLKTRRNIHKLTFSISFHSSKHLLIYTHHISSSFSLTIRLNGVVAIIDSRVGRWHLAQLLAAEQRSELKTKRCWQFRTETTNCLTCCLEPLRRRKSALT